METQTQTQNPIWDGLVSHFKKYPGTKNLEEWIVEMVELFNKVSHHKKLSANLAQEVLMMDASVDENGSGASFIIVTKHGLRIWMLIENDSGVIRIKDEIRSLTC
jgi:hypothetical protein